MQAKQGPAVHGQAKGTVGGRAGRDWEPRVEMGTVRRLLPKLALHIAHCPQEATAPHTGHHAGWPPFPSVLALFMPRRMEMTGWAQ